MDRRQFLCHTAKSLLLLAEPALTMASAAEPGADQGAGQSPEQAANQAATPVRLLLTGDVMTGRGIDQALPHPSYPQIYENYVKDARRYLELAEAANGAIAKPVSFSYIWGDALGVLESKAPDVRIINLETSVTRSDDYWRDKGINYRMHPANIGCITSAGIDCCVLANNHVLDWGYEGLKESLKTLGQAGLKWAGAGASLAEAAKPLLLEVAGKCRVIVISAGLESSGIPTEWAAKGKRAGVNLLPDLSSETVRRIGEAVLALKGPRDIVVFSIHWGGNWGYQIPDEHTLFAHRLIDNAGIDVVHGHSSHHALGIEVYRDRPIIYGCGDLINDYEGIGGYESYRGDLSLLYFLDIAPASGRLIGLELIPLQIRRFSLHHASSQDALWLRVRLAREGQKFNTGVALNEKGGMNLQWVSSAESSM